MVCFATAGIIGYKGLHSVHYLVHVRVVSEILHPECKITIFHWNNRYLIKLEKGHLEQTYKVQEYDVSSEAEVRSMLTEDFIGQALKTFEEMHLNLQQAIQKI